MTSESALARSLTKMPGGTCAAFVSVRSARKGLTCSLV